MLWLPEYFSNFMHFKSYPNSKMQHIFNIMFFKTWHPLNCIISLNVFGVVLLCQNFKFYVLHPKISQIFIVSIVSSKGRDKKLCSTRSVLSRTISYYIVCIVLPPNQIMPSIFFYMLFSERTFHVFGPRASPLIFLILKYNGLF